MIDYTGYRFGWLMVIGEAEPYKNYPKWKCRCDCGKEIVVFESNLRSGNTKSCGCKRFMRGEKPPESTPRVKSTLKRPRTIDLTGQRFGQLMVIREAESRRNSVNVRMRYWLCKCDCGKEKEVFQRSLLSGATKSCGCLKAEAAKKAGERFVELHKGE